MNMRINTAEYVIRQIIYNAFIIAFCNMTKKSTTILSRAYIIDTPITIKSIVVNLLLFNIIIKRQTY